MVIIKILFLVVLMMVLVLVEVQARPGFLEEYQTNPMNNCEENITVIEICQRCAKRTKSNIVYPMCCTNEDDAFEWCNQYLFYGRQNSDND